MNHYAIFAVLALALSGCAVGAERVANACSASFGRDLAAHADCAEREANVPALLTSDMGITGSLARQYAQATRLAASGVSSGEATPAQAWAFLAQAQNSLGQQGQNRMDTWRGNAVPAFSAAAIASRPVYAPRPVTCVTQGMFTTCN